MTLKHIDEYRDADISKSLLGKIETISKKNIRLMEVCGTHTVSIFRSGIRSVLPKTISLLSGPGCPVCVTDQAEVDAFIELARIDDVIITTFGDLMRVPGTKSSLQKESAAGRDIRVVYSTFDALEIARKNSTKKVVFLGVGFETTAPTIAASILSAAQQDVKNFSVISAHKLVPPALGALMGAEDVKIDGFILPGHVSVIIGLKSYSLQDMGSCVSHKSMIIKKVEVDKKDPLIVAKETNHSVWAVDRYIKDFNRVRVCYQDGKDKEFISLATGLSKFVVNEYLSIIENSFNCP